MTQLVNVKTGKLEDVSPQVADKAVAQGLYAPQAGTSVNMVGQDGQTYEVPAEQAQYAMSQGSQLETPAQAQDRQNQAAYGDAAPAAAALGFMRGASFGLFDEIGKQSLGDDYVRAANALEKYNPISSTLGEIGGNVAVTAATGGLGGVPELAATKLVGLGTTTESVLGKFGVGAVRGAIEGGAFGAGQALSEKALGNPEETGELLAQHIGLGALIGGATGGAFSLAGSAFNYLGSTAAGQATADTAKNVLRKIPVIPGARDVSEYADAVKTLSDLDANKASLSPEGQQAYIQAQETIANTPFADKAQYIINNGASTLASKFSKIPKELYFNILNDPNFQADVVNGMSDETRLATMNQAKELFESVPKQASKGYSDAVNNAFDSSITPESADTVDAFHQSSISPLTDAQAQIAKRPKYYSPSTSNILDTAMDTMQGRNPDLGDARDLLAQRLGLGPDATLSDMLNSAKTHPEAAELVPQINKLQLQSAIAAKQEIGKAIKWTAKNGGNNYDQEILRNTSSALNDTLKGLGNSPGLKGFSDQYQEADSLYSQFLKKWDVLKDQVYTGSGTAEHFDEQKFLNFLQAGGNKAFKVDSMMGAAKDFLGKYGDADSQELMQNLSGFREKALTLKAFEDMRGASGPSSGGIISGAVRLGALMGVLPKWLLLAESVGTPYAYVRGLEGVSTAVSKAQGLIATASAQAQRGVIAEHVKDAMNSLMKSVPQRAITTPLTRYSAGDYDNKVKQIQAAIDNVGDKWSALNLPAEMAPVQNEVTGAAIGGLQYLHSKIPNTAAGGTMTPLGPVQRQATPSEKMSFLRSYQAVNDPLSVIKQLKQGVVTKEGMEALASVYPETYQQVAMGMSHVLQQKGAMDKMPYQNKLKLAQFFNGQIDGTTSQRFIANSQAVYASPLAQASPMPAHRLPQSGLAKLDGASRQQSGLDSVLSRRS